MNTLCPTCNNPWEQICGECKQLFEEELEHQKLEEPKLFVGSGEDVNISEILEFNF